MKRSTRKNRAKSVRINFSQVEKSKDSKRLPCSEKQRSGAGRRISARQLREYKQDILDKIGDFSFIYADLEKQCTSGDGWITAQCPLHNDRNPSFSFSMEHGRWICHAGCGEEDIFDFLTMKTS